MVWGNLGELSGPEYMESFYTILDRIDEGHADDSVRTLRLSSAMTSLVGLASRLHQEPDSGWVTDEMPEFRARAHDLLSRYRPILSGYIAGMETAIWEGTPEGWLEASIKRSAVQTIIDELDQNNETPLVELQRLREDDEDMLETAPSIPSLQPDEIPPLPDNHWWWRAPKVPTR